MSTPHNSALPGDFAKTVLMPGDPLRAKYVADHFLEEPRLVNNVRGVQGYTGCFEGTRVSVMASGMGMPSIAIYSHELFSVYGVENIIRIGSAGALQENIRLRDLVIGMGACTNSRFAHTFSLPGDFAPIADYSLLSRAVNLARREGFRFHVGNLLSSDTFYNDEEGLPREQTAAEKWRKMGVLAIEMEAAA
ncbi:MAG: purine-nucleoside phosphorylase, partial [Clostridia bacterium]|nr:purine-nucleoside phosphorylase [Clostridia bacterium]